ncbi:MAG: serpin family protein [Planctomycetota bacterium]|jgi:serpin B
MRHIRSGVVLISAAMVTITAAVGQTADQAELVRGNTQFALDLYAKLCSDSAGNVFCAPQCISTALAMTYAGARAETAEEMARTLHFDLGQDRQHAAFAALAEALAHTSDEAEGDSRFTIANRLWGQEGEPFLPSYLETIRTHYAGGFETVDFRSAPENARLRINDWTAQQTADRIKELFRRGEIDATTVLALVNAIHFKGTWRTQFDPQRTRDGDFHVPGQEAAVVPMMNLTADLGYGETDLFQAVSLPYEGQRLEMVVLLPARRDGLADLEAALTAGNLESWLGRLRKQTVRVSLPRFSTRSRFELSRTLVEMGMPSAFSGAADFSGMNGRPHDLFISIIVHEAFIDVDEQGTEAAAATGVAMKRGGGPPAFVADHPFLFLIRDRESGSVVFLGRIVQPSAGAA